jgi:glycosyltransferase involved in cell wall biosynthesis
VGPMTQIASPVALPPQPGPRVVADLERAAARLPGPEVVVGEAIGPVAPAQSDGFIVLWEASLTWFIGELPPRWLANRYGLCLDAMNLQCGPLDMQRLRAVPLNAAWFFDTRGAAYVGTRLRREIHAAGGRVLVSCDEEWWEVPSWIGMGADYEQKQRPFLERGLAEADQVVVFSRRMAERVERFNRSIVVLPHALPPLADLPRRLPRRGAGIRIGWVGTQQHGGDLAMLGPAMQQLLARRPDVTFVLAGQCFPRWALAGSPQIELHPAHRALPDYYRWIASLALDVFVTPLVEHPFNVVKPCLKPLEAAGLGIPVLASAVGSYAEELRHDETALLVANTTEAWLTALTRLVEDAPLRAHLSACGLAWAATRTIDATGPLWAKLWAR